METYEPRAMVSDRDMMVVAHMPRSRMVPEGENML